MYNSDLRSSREWVEGWPDLDSGRRGQVHLHGHETSHNTGREVEERERTAAIAGSQLFPNSLTPAESREFESPARYSRSLTMKVFVNLGQNVFWWKKIIAQLLLHKF